MSINEVRRSAIQRFINPSEFGHRLKEYRLSAGLTVSEMADVLGHVHQRTISRWENEGVVPRSKIIISKLNEMKVI